MSIADHFQQAPDAHYIRDYDAGAARRQFQLSLTLVAIIALVAAMLGMVVRFDLPASQADSAAVATLALPAMSTSAPPAYAGKL